MRRFALAIAALGLLNACGDGGSTPSAPVVTGGSAASPTPTSTPTPSSSSLQTGEVKPSADASYLSATLELDTTGSANNSNGQYSGGTTSNRAVSIDTPSFRGAYNSTSGYSLSDAVNAATFGPNQLVSDDIEKNRTVTFAIRATNMVDYLVLYRNKFSSSPNYVEYIPKLAGLASWQHSTQGFETIHTRIDYFAYGTPTPVGSMPKTGIGKYYAQGSANLARDSSLYFATHNDQMNIDFAKGTFSANITLAGGDFFSGSFGGLFGAHIVGTINGNEITGPVTRDDSGYTKGTFHLRFIGPTASEFILTFTGISPYEAFAGSSVGVLDPDLPG